jgi:hypothetical protein
MIISHQHRFVFFHNPKVGGTSVRATIEHLHDADEVFWGADPERQGAPLDRAHLGIDEFAQHYPDLWTQVQGYRMFCLYRDPLGRFFSSLGEYSKLHGEVDTRFAGPAARKAALMAMTRDLETYGTAEVLMDHYPLRHFRPQWIYWTCQSRPDLDITALPVTQIAKLFEEISALSGQELQTAIRNQGDQLDLPGPLAALASSRRAKSLLRGLPGASALKTGLRRAFRGGGSSTDRFGLGPAEQRDMQEFVNRFYARDLALWPESQT